jgi:hypothetical protein
MIHTNRLTIDQLTASDYKLIEGTDPKRYHTKYDMVFDDVIQKTEDEFLKDEDVVFAVLFDKNGYVPTHNTKYSLPPGKDYQKDLFHSRSKRNFSNQEEIRIILQQHKKDTFMYPYHRDTGETMWNIGAPVILQGNHWGSFVIGVSLQRMDIIKNQLVIIIVTLMIINLSFTLLIILAVIPRKYLLPAQQGNEPGATGGQA